jgi:hypothetical protein
MNVRDSDLVTATTIALFLFSPSIRIDNILAQERVGSSRAMIDTEWTFVNERWLKYVENPTEGNATLVLATLPGCSDTIDEAGANFDQAETAISRHAEILAKQMRLGKGKAVAVAFRIAPFSDGDLAERIGDMFGDLLRDQPHLFLQSAIHYWCQDMPLDFFVIGFGSGHRKLNLEYSIRIKRLQAIKDPSLRTLRDQCIKILEEAK